MIANIIVNSRNGEDQTTGYSLETKANRDALLSAVVTGKSGKHIKINLPILK
ncbi:hypothetical protein [Lactobacillus corticis]|uniref:Uncharacterized protein n=1 Tax=Lactobacillus corticis TaxID=2201249 RepID=A0A916VI37_9LACO|nr:hypothetical protein [Lactobacillus corticis]GFZ26908.1 hypothetical protein LCB40_07880 [Lactobacillus corticis]